MSDTITLRLQISPEDLRKAGYDISKLGDKPITLKVPSKPLGDLPEQAKYAEGTVGALKEKMAKLNSEIDHLKDQGAIKAKQGEIKALGDQVDGLTGKLKPTGQTDMFAGMLPSITKVGTAMAGIGILLDITKTGFENVVAKESAMADLRAITGLTAAEVKNLADKATDLSDEFGTKTVSNIDAMKIIISKFGPEVAKSADDLDSMTRSINVLSKTSPALADTSKTAEILANSVNAFGLSSASSAEKALFMARATDVLAAGAQAGSIEADQISESLLKAGTTMDATNVSLEEGVAAIEVLGIVMSNGAENGNALKNVQLKLQEGRFLPPDTTKALQAAGVDISKLSDKSLSLADRLEVLKPVAGDTALIVKLFGTENVVAAQHLIKNTDQIRSMTTAVSQQGIAMQQATVQMDTMKERWARTSNFLENSVVKVLTPITDSLMTMVGGIEKLSKGDIWEGWKSNMAGFLEFFSGISLAKGIAGILGFGDGSEEAGKKTKAATVQYNAMKDGALGAFSAVGAAAQKTAKILELPTVEIVKTKDALNKLKGAPAGSIQALIEHANKLEESFRKMRTDNAHWFDAKEGVRIAKEDVDLIMSGAVEQFGNNVDLLRLFIKKKAAEGDASPIEKALAGQEVTENDFAPVTVSPLSEALKEAMEKFGKEAIEMRAAAEATGQAFGQSLARGIESGEPALKAVLKSLLMGFLDYLEKQVVLAELGILLTELVTKGPLGFLTAALSYGAITAAFTLAKSAVTGFATGGIIVGERGPEVIAPAKEFSEFAGSIVSNAIGFMAAAMGKLNDMEMASRRIDVNSNVQFNQARVAIEGHQLVAYLNAHSYREQRASLGW